MQTLAREKRGRPETSKTPDYLWEIAKAEIMRGSALAAGKRPNDLHGKSRRISEPVVDAAR
jgi:hypothetical protein